MSKDKIVVEYTGPWRVVLTYFKESGKYYSDGEYLSQKLQLYEIWDEVKEMLSRGERPGLVEGFSLPFVYVDVPDHPHRHPILIQVQSGESSH